jgi:zona occludens toxin
MAGIIAFVGLPGAGKSYSAVDAAIIPALEEKRRIVTNLPLNLDAVGKDFFGGDIDLMRSLVQIVDSDDLKQAGFFNDIAGGSLVVLDEVWRLWKSGTKTSSVSEEHMSFVKEHRHRSDENGRSLDIVLVTQNLVDIATFLREMVETTVITRKLTAVGADTKFQRFYCQGAIKGFECSEGAVLKDEFGSYDPKIYQYYKTHMNANPMMGGALKVDEKRAVKGQTVFSSWKFKVMAVIAFIFIAGSIYSGKKSVDAYEQRVKPPEPAKVVEPSKPNEPITAPPVLAYQAPPPPPPVHSERWRLTGYISQPNQNNFYLISDGRITRKISPSSCEKHDFDSVCTVDGEIVAAYTGKKESSESVYLASASKHIEEKGLIPSE